MLTIRLQRVGRTNDPSFRVVVTEAANGPRSGKYVEVLGSYDARKGKAQLEKERIAYWLSVGAKASGTIHNLLVSHKILKEPKINLAIRGGKGKKKEAGAAQDKAVEGKPSEVPAAAVATV